MPDNRPYSDYYRSVSPEEPPLPQLADNMGERFETFVTAIAQIYRCIHRLKSDEMAAFGLKGAHVMVLYQLQQHEQGLTAVQLAQVCEEDKAAISRTVAELKNLGLVSQAETKIRRYRLPITLTEKGREITGQMNRKIVEAVMENGYGYSTQDRDLFYRILLKISDNLQAACAERDSREDQA